MSNVVAIVQARLGSTRLPGKTLADIAGRPMLWHVVNRLKWATSLNETVVATTVKEADKAIIRFAGENGIRSYAGSEDDVLDRFYQAATEFKADVIVRVTPDCPMIDPMVVNKVVKRFEEGGFDYVANTITPTYPDGLDTEVFSSGALKRAWEEAGLKSEREHVTPYLWKHPEVFKVYNVSNDKDLSHLRWTVDEAEDLEFVREVYRRLYKEGGIFYMEDVLGLLRQHPELLAINKGYQRNEGYDRSIKADRRGR